MHYATAGGGGNSSAVDKWAAGDSYVGGYHEDKRHGQVCVHCMALRGRIAMCCWTTGGCHGLAPPTLGASDSWHMCRTHLAASLQGVWSDKHGNIKKEGRWQHGAFVEVQYSTCCCLLLLRVRTMWFAPNPLAKAVP